MSGVVLGVNSAYHEPAACLVVDGRVVAMVEEERFNRVRHGKRALIDNSDDLPEAAMAWCLASAGLGWGEVDDIAYSLDPEARYRTNRHRHPERSAGWGTEAGERCFRDANLRARDRLLARAPRARFHFIPHHLCHAASAFYASPFTEAAILVVDGIGEGDSTWLGVGRGADISGLETVPYPHSLGFVWETMSEYLGLDPYSGPGKVMGYAAITDPRGELTGHDHLSTMAEILHPVAGGTFAADEDAFRFGSGDFSGLERRFGPRRKALVDRYEDASVAAALQEVTNDVLVHLARRLDELVNRDRETPVRDLCLAGGVALNCVANFHLAARTSFERLWVQPAANDAGTALGAALVVAVADGGRRWRMDHAALGPGFDEAAMAAALDRAGLTRRQAVDLPAEVARRLAAGQIVAWFQGRQEVGPRALGQRSILCDPSRFDSRTRINLQVKRRESFRPFAPSLLEPALDRFFAPPGELLATRFMLAALPLVDPVDRQVIPAVIQENGSTGVATSRVHLVDGDHNPAYRELLTAMEGEIGMAVVLNTSFNIQEPIVTTPDEAVATFLRSAMDALALGPFLVEHPERT